MTKGKSVIISVAMIVAFELAWYTGSNPVAALVAAVALSILTRCWIGYRQMRRGGEFRLD